jgi:hypothetical protein
MVDTKEKAMAIFYEGAPCPKCGSRRSLTRPKVFYSVLGDNQPDWLCCIRGCFIYELYYRKLAEAFEKASNWIDELSEALIPWYKKITVPHNFVKN